MQALTGGFRAFGLAPALVAGHFSQTEGDQMPKINVGDSKQLIIGFSAIILFGVALVLLQHCSFEWLG